VTEHTCKWPAPLEMHALAMEEPERPRFIVDDWMPQGYASLLAGHGGGGKSGLALHLACCIALGRPFFGQACERRRVVYLSCEDRWEVLHWRLSHIARYLDIDLGELDGWLFLHDLVGEDTTLRELDRNTGMALTPGFSQLRQRMAETDGQVLIVDGVSDTFAGNENDRGNVKRYVNSLLSLIPADGALLLIAHVDKLAARVSTTGQGYSGSTAWHNAVRARWYLRPDRDESDEGADQASRDLLLELQKSNLGPTAASIRFAWDESAHMFVGRPEDAVGGFVEGIRDRTERDAILRAIVAATDAGVHIPAALQGSRTAYMVISHRDEFPESLRGDTRPKKRRFVRHLEALRHIRHIADARIRRSNRHEAIVIQPTTEGRAACAA
jgi:RecA-family ATPase